MPDWKIHLVFGLLISIFWFNVFYFGNIHLNFLDEIIILILILLSSIFADVDLMKSKARNLFSLILALTISCVYLYFYRTTWYYAPFYFLILYFLFRYIPSKHRGILHSIKFSIVFSFLLVLLCYFFLGLDRFEFLLWFWIVFSSYNLHLLIDKF